MNNFKFFASPPSYEAKTKMKNWLHSLTKVSQENFWYAEDLPSL